VTRLLLDTTFFIDAERSGDGLDELIDDGDDIAVAAVTIAELRVGALMAKGKRRSIRIAYVDDVIATIPTLDYDLEVAKAHAELLVEVRTQGKPRSAHDLIIAATAMAFGRTIVSADSSAFQQLPGIKVRGHR